MLPSYYEFYNPVKIISGHKALDNIAFELSQKNAKRPMIITDKGVVEAGLLNTLIKAFSSSEITIGAVFDNVPPDSSLELVKDIAHFYKQNSCDSLIALGGGSPIDTAKAVNILVSNERGDLKDYMGVDRLKGPLKPLCVIPTTAGTGSEVTQVAVIADLETKVKMLLVSRYLLPDLAVLDPRMTLSMPIKISAATAMDALSHAMEAYIGLQKNPLSDAYAISAISLIRKYLPVVIENEKDKNARLALANASCMAGIAFSNSMVGMVHALGHAAGAVSNIAHGVAMNIFLPYGLAYNLKLREKALSDLLLHLAGSEIYSSTAPQDRAYRLLEVLSDIQAFLEKNAFLPRTLKAAGAKREDLDKIALKAINDGALIMNPEDMSLEDAKEILNKAF